MAGPFVPAFSTTLQDGFPTTGSEVAASPAVIPVPAGLVNEPKVFLQLQEPVALP